jgi:two-component system phosphate regulon sensor histidine kinase PhoR
VVRTYQDTASVCLEVTDTGIGIAAEDIPRIFESFFRTEGARQQSARGTGLGLPIVKRIVDLHGGQIQVESQPGRGSTFRVAFPAAN